MTENIFARAGYEPLRQVVAMVDEGGRKLPTLQSVGGASAADQFVPFQLTADPAQRILDLHAATAKLPGSEEKPDVQLRIELVSFQVNEAAAAVAAGAQATLRLDIGQDQASTPERDPVFWSIAAGLDIAARAVGGELDARRGADFGQAFRRRPIEIAGGLAELRIQLVVHEPPPWWRRIFTFADNAAVRKLVAAVGFPGIALDAVKLLDEAMGRFDEARATPILQSRPLTVALSARAAEEFSGGLDVVRPAVLNEGIHIMLRQADAERVRARPPVYLGGLGRLVPADAWDGQRLTVTANDPYEDLSYLVLRVRSREARITDPF